MSKERIMAARDIETFFFVLLAYEIYIGFSIRSAEMITDIDYGHK